jgi:BirA family biotin operon repressor/biotin-[acetyl-CoA-carboxylase] ligase
LNSKERVLNLLKQEDGGFLSGESIAQTLGISRTSVWKAIQSLRQEGENIEAVTNRGYRLSDNPGDLSFRILREEFPEEETLRILASTDSTNREAKILALQGAPDGTAVIAKEQSDGAGHGTHRFWSPKGGIYLSVIRRFESSVFKSSRDITKFGAYAACQAISSVCALNCQIRPVNDLYYNGRKIGGILTEGMEDAETGQMNWTVIGVGISFCIRQETFPRELQARCSSLYPDGKAGSSLSRLACELIRRLRGTPPDADTLEKLYDSLIIHT